MSIEDIIEYLSKTKNPVQLVKHYDEVPESKKSFPMIAQRKYDGVYCLIVVIDGIKLLFSRTGKELYIESICNILPNELSDGVYITEMCNDAISLEVLSGLVSPNRTKEWEWGEYATMRSSAYFMFHDYLSVEEFINGKSDIECLDRWYKLRAELRKKDLSKYLVDFKFVYDDKDVLSYFESCVRLGYEGSVFKQPESDWVAGHKGYRAMKLVRGVSLDLLCTGVKYGKGKREGQIAALEFEYKGNKFYADLGKGWDDIRRGNLTEAYELNWTLEDTPSGEINPVGKIWEVKALQLSSTGKALRLPKSECIIS